MQLSSEVCNEGLRSSPLGKKGEGTYMVEKDTRRAMETESRVRI